MTTMTDAVRALAYEPACTDAAVVMLESLAARRREPELLSNLSAAYYLRAQRKDRPSDFIRALDAADSAVALGTWPAARFNRALAEETLGFSGDALASWNGLRRGKADGWRREAAEHWNELEKQRTVAAAIQWRLNEQRLPEMVRNGDARAVEALVNPYRAAAQRLVEENVLPGWAAAKARGDEATAAERLQEAFMIASALARLTQDRYLLDVVEQIRRAGPGAEQATRNGITAYTLGLVEEGKIRNEGATAAAYERAAESFTASGNPFRLMAMIKRAAFLTLGGRFDEASRLLVAVEAEATRADYPSIIGRVKTARGYVAMMQGRLLDSAAEYADAESAFRRTADVETLCKTLTREVGVYRLIGNHELTWRTILKTGDCASSMLEAQSRHIFLGEVALAALELGYPHVALRYQTSAVDLLLDALARNANDEALVAKIISNLGIAYRARAAIYAHLGNDQAALHDLQEAMTRIGNDKSAPDAAIVNGFRARLAEVEAQTLEASKRHREAIAALSRGIDYAKHTHFSSLLASLLVERADLQSLAGDTAAEIDDLRAALKALRREEQAMLGGRRPHDVSEQMWSAYFARYQQTYRRLIQRLIERGNDIESFDYAEKARAFEPLHLILARDDVPSDFRAHIHNREPFHLEDVKHSIPDGTFLLQYGVMDTQTFVWVIWNRDFARATLPVGNAQIERWTSALQRLGRSSDFERFHAALADPYEALLREPLARVAKINSGHGLPRVIIIPDRAMHGLPFAALRNGRRYVIQDYIVSVAASATLYAYSLSKDRQRDDGGTDTALIVADPAFDRRPEVARDLPRLPWARAEAATIGDLYRDTIHVDPLIGDEATPAEFLRLARESSIIHVAAHGIANPDIPSHSFLLFAPSGNDSGAVDADRLLRQLKLRRARLVVLAACSSAGGTPVGPEGLAPLVRPLLVAGTPGVIGTLWNVKENSETTQLLVRFHHHYLNGHDADDALRLAQLEMLGDPELDRSSAVAWAPFQAIGHASSPFKHESRR